MNMLVSVMYGIFGFIIADRIYSTNQEIAVYGLGFIIGMGLSILVPPTSLGLKHLWEWVTNKKKARYSIKQAYLSLSLDQETDGRWIAESKDPLIMVYGQTAQEAVDKAMTTAYRVWADRLEHGDDGEVT
jgi:hypothetical protein